MRSPSPTRSTISRTRPRGARRPASRSGSSTFWATFRVGIRLNAWNTKPTCSRRISVSAVSDKPFSSRPASSTRPDVGGSRPAATCRSVLFPEPDGPMTAVKVCASNSMSTPSSARTACGPRPYVFVTSSSLAATFGLWVGCMEGSFGKPRASSHHPRAKPTPTKVGVIASAGAAAGGALPDRQRTRARRDGRRLPRPPAGFGAQRGAQRARGVPRRGRIARAAVHPRGARGRLAEPPERRDGLRLRPCRTGSRTSRWSTSSAARCGRSSAR